MTEGLPKQETDIQLLRKFQFLVEPKGSSQYTILSQDNPFQTLTLISLKSTLILSFHLQPDLPGSLKLAAVVMLVT